MSPRKDISDKLGRGCSGCVCLKGTAQLFTLALVGSRPPSEEKNYQYLHSQSPSIQNQAGMFSPLPSRQGTGVTADCCHTGNRTTFVSAQLQ